MKLFSALLIVAACVFVGRSIIDRIKDRECALKETVYLIDELIAAVNYSKKPLVLLLGELNSPCRFADECLRQLDLCGEITTAWKNACTGKKLNMNEDSCRMLCDMGLRLGKSDCETELRMLKDYRCRFSDILELKIKEDAECIRLYASGSWLVGLFLAIFVM